MKMTPQKTAVMLHSNTSLAEGTQIFPNARYTKWRKAWDSDRRRRVFTPPFLRTIRLRDDAQPDWDRFPFNTQVFAGRRVDIAFTHQTTILVGENASGKSTLLEAIAANCGFNPEGGTQNHFYETDEPRHHPLADHVRFAWLPKVQFGLFLRAETFFNLSRHMDDVNQLGPFGEPSTKPIERLFHGHSHGEAFRRLFDIKLKGPGIFLLDEPEAALSPTRLLELLVLLGNVRDDGMAQVVIATHSPIIMAFPGAALWEITPGGIRVADYDDLDHVRTLRRVLNHRQAVMDAVLGDRTLAEPGAGEP